MTHFNQISHRIARSVSGFKSTMAIMMERRFMSYEAVVRAQLGHLQEGCFGCSTLSTGTAECLSIAWLSFPPNQEVLFAWASPSDDLGDLQQGLRFEESGVHYVQSLNIGVLIPESDEPDARLERWTNIFPSTLFPHLAPTCKCRVNIFLLHLCQTINNSFIRVLLLDCWP